jgi:hypothetical protein
MTYQVGIVLDELTSIQWRDSEPGSCMKYQIWKSLDIYIVSLAVEPQEFGLGFISMLVNEHAQVCPTVEDIFIRKHGLIASLAVKYSINFFYSCVSGWRIKGGAPCHYWIAAHDDEIEDGITAKFKANVRIHGGNCRHRNEI